MRKRNGFTLAELLAVMAILMILAAIGIPTGGRQIQAARNQQSQTLLAVTMDNAFLQALKQSRTQASPYEVQIPDDALQALKDLAKSADVTVSCGKEAATIAKATIPQNADTVKYIFQVDGSENLIFHSVVFYISGIAAYTVSVP